MAHVITSASSADKIVYLHPATCSCERCFARALWRLQRLLWSVEPKAWAS